MSKVREEVFTPDNFEFIDMDSTFRYDFNPEVASEIANAVFYADGGRRNHQHAESFIGQTIEVAAGNYTTEPQALNPNRLPAPRVFVPRNTIDTYQQNAVFAREFQRELDKREYANRMSVPLTLGFTATIDSIPTGILFAAFSPNGITKEEALLAGAVGIALGHLAVLGKMPVENIYRKIVTNPKNQGIHQAHLSKAVRTAEELNLDPVITRRWRP